MSAPGGATRKGGKGPQKPSDPRGGYIHLFKYVRIYLFTSVSVYMYEELVGSRWSLVGIINNCRSFYVWSNICQGPSPPSSISNLKIKI